ncbi:MAG: hypothetical protein AAB510_01065 [Patescibacteria group bacterium]
MSESLNLIPNILKDKRWHKKMPETVALYEECIGCTIEELKDNIKNLLSTIPGIGNVDISFRVKHPETLQKKIKMKEVQSIFSIDDVYGIRILVNSVNEVYKILEKISATFPGYVDHDYIKKPKIGTSGSNKDKKLQLIQFVAYKNEMPFEIQITTTTFHEENERLHAEYHSRKYS